jgi:hypothetical protein
VLLRCARLCRGLTWPLARAVREVFSGIQNSEASMEFMVQVSYVEIYLEKVRDLLNPGAARRLIRPQPSLA